VALSGYSPLTGVDFTAVRTSFILPRLVGSRTIITGVSACACPDFPLRISRSVLPYTFKDVVGIGVLIIKDINQESNGIYIHAGPEKRQAEFLLNITAKICIKYKGK
jgi:hypothetical protein